MAHFRAAATRPTGRSASSIIPPPLTPSPWSKESNPARDERPADPRKSCRVRFTDSELEEVKSDAETQDLPAAEFVRERILPIARNTSVASVPADFVPFIERTLRYTYMMETKMRDEMASEDRAGEMEKFIASALDLQESVRRGPPR